MFDTDDFKDRVREATDIVAIIGQYVTLKKRGKNYLGLCPFHTEKTPSFSVHPDRQFYHCFGCGKGGDVFTFVMEHEGWSFPEALKYLAEKAGIPLPRRHAPEENDRFSRLYAANAMAAKFFAQEIHRPGGRKALDYVVGRGVLTSRLVEFGIGYAPEGWDNLIRHAASRNIGTQDLQHAGLAVQREDITSTYDRFRNRVTFAIANLSGRVVGFGARSLDDAEQAKYINSPETPVYQKSRILYGLDKARETIRRMDCAVVVEGYMDWISLYQTGIGNVVASSGTAFTPEQARLLARFSPNAVLLFDADAAGQKAALRGVEVLFREGLDVKIATLPPGLDPDNAVREHGRDFVEQTLRTASGYVAFRVGQACASLRRGGLIEQEQVIKELLATAAVVDDRVRRALLVRQIAEATGISEADLHQQLPTVPGGGTTGPSPRRPGIRRTRRDLEIEFLKALLERPDWVRKVKLEINTGDFREPQLGRLYDQLATIEPMPEHLLPTELGETPQDKSAWAEIAARDLGLEVTDEIAGAYVERMRAARPRADLEEAKRQIKHAEERGDLAEANRLLREHLEKRLTSGGQKGKL